MSAPFDPLRALRVLVRYDVRFVVIGGIAGRLWGSPTVTNDLDVCPAWDGQNLERLAAALRELRASLRGVDEDVPLRLDARTLSAGHNFTFATSAGAVDVIGAPAGALSFVELLARAETIAVAADLSVLVVDLGDLITLKRVAGRPKDLIEVEVLEAVRSVIEAQGRQP